MAAADSGIGSALQRERSFGGIRIEADHDVACRFRYLGREQAEKTQANHEHCVPQRELGLPDALHRNGTERRVRRAVRRDTLRHTSAEAAGYDNEFRVIRVARTARATRSPS